MHDVPWFLTVVYGSPQVGNRRELWDGLEGIVEVVSNPWPVGGDFNSMLRLEDAPRSSSLATNTRRFNDCVW